MCSIAGFISANPLPQQISWHLARALLYYGHSRGQQSSGVHVEMGDGKSGLYKKAKSPDNLIDDQQFGALFKNPTKMCLLHTRMPTSGGRDDAQAQPFHIGKTIAVHNGHYNGEKLACEKYGIKYPSGVDSELICSFAEKQGVDQIGEFLKTTPGMTAAGLIQDGKMFLVRDINPLHYAHLEWDDDKIAVFASTRTMLESAIRHCWLFRDASNSIQSMDSEQVFELTPDDLIKVGKEFESFRYGTHTTYTPKRSWTRKDEKGGADEPTPFHGAGAYSHFGSEELDDEYTQYWQEYAECRSPAKITTDKFQTEKRIK